MKTTGLCFTGEMVRALLANQKFQTRRIFKPKSEPWLSHFQEGGCCKSDWSIQNLEVQSWWQSAFAAPEPIGKLPNAPGDMLYVKESFCVPGLDRDGNRIVCYKATGDPVTNGTPWKSGRFMPKLAARIWLEVTACRFDWLQQISPFDAIKEGIDTKSLGHDTTEECNARMPEVCEFRRLWDRIYGKHTPWSSNPLVVVREFRRIEKPQL